MTKPDQLTNLAEFSAQAEQRAIARDQFWDAFGKTTRAAHRARPSRRVGDLLGSVLALSARTRRMVKPKAFTELDVFGPGGNRAVRLYMQD